MIIQVFNIVWLSIISGYFLSQKMDFYSLHFQLIFYICAYFGVTLNMCIIEMEMVSVALKTLLSLIFKNNLHMVNSNVKRNIWVSVNLMKKYSKDRYSYTCTYADRRIKKVNKVIKD